MSNMYGLVIGNSGWPKALMDIMWDITPEMVGRYRDHWLEKDESGDEPALVLAVYARIGGGNREEYADNIRQMQALTTYVSDADDSYDNTYATFRFRMSRTDFIARMVAQEVEHKVEVTDGSSYDDVWDELWDQAEPIPRDMSVIWQAMISSLPGNFDEKV
jgi:hypothetical protein